MVLLETLRKLDLYLNVVPDTPRIITNVPAWYHGSVIVEGEVISYRWNNLDPP
jgi:hypothetical protein